MRSECSSNGVMDEEDDVLRRLDGGNVGEQLLEDCKSFCKMLLDGISLLLLMLEGVMVDKGHLNVVSSSLITGFFSSVALRLLPRFAWTLTRGRLIADIFQGICVKI